MSIIFRYISKLLLLISAFFLLFGLNVAMGLDNGLYFMGGSGTTCGMGVEGQFKLGFLLFLAITDIVLILATLRILMSKMLKSLYILLALLCCIGLFFLNIFLSQPRLFQGYEFTEGIDTYDAAVIKCYLYYGPHDALLLLVTFIGLATLFASRKGRW